VIEFLDFHKARKIESRERGFLTMSYCSLQVIEFLDFHEASKIESRSVASYNVHGYSSSAQL